jgi:hypothetical protein
MNNTSKRKGDASIGCITDYNCKGATIVRFITADLEELNSEIARPWSEIPLREQLGFYFNITLRIDERKPTILSSGLVRQDPCETITNVLRPHLKTEYISTVFKDEVVA